MQYSECDVCGSDITTPSQSRTNKQTMQAFRLQAGAALPANG